MIDILRCLLVGFLSFFLITLVPKNMHPLWVCIVFNIIVAILILIFY